MSCAVLIVVSLLAQYSVIETVRWCLFLYAEMTTNYSRHEQM
jgi:hypothetical protein